MKLSKRCCLLILAAAIGGFVLRLPRLEQRPMHADEAVHAEKFGLLLEEGLYRYDPNEYHGPVLNYLTLVPAWLSSAEKLTEVNEFTLRIVPVFFGMCLILLLLLPADGLGRTGVVFAAILTAISPAFVFYSRYYIHEMLLVCFTFGVITCGYRYTQSKNIKWALLTGIFLGLMHATKETCIIAFGSIVLAVLLTILFRRRDTATASQTLRPIKPLHYIAALAVAAAVSALFYSSFLANTRGILDSLLTYTNYLNRAGQNQFHIHPWYYYLKMLIYSRYDAGPVWSEALIVILAAVGFAVAMTRKGLPTVDFNLLRFITFYTAIMTVLYSIIPYKTPWCMLGFLHGMIVLAGVGAAAVVKLAPNILGRVLIGLLLVSGTVHLTRQTYLGNYRFYADTCNPYVYAHTSTDVFTIIERVKDVAKVHPDHYEMPIAVVCPESYWPVPWYLRSFPNVGYWKKVDKDVPAAPVIIASASVEQALLKNLYELRPPGKRDLYVPLFDSPVYLRPQVELLGLVTKQLWDSFQQHNTSSALSRTKDEK